jgi:YggT family protein
MYAIGIPLGAIVEIVDGLLWIYTLIILAALILSWTNPDPMNVIVRLLRSLTEPVFDRIRPYIPLVGGLDLTPAVLLVAIFFFRNGILSVIARFARDISN